MNQTMDEAIVRVKTIYEQVTGAAAPEPTPDAPYARIPPEVDAEEYVTMKAAALLEKVRSFMPAVNAVQSNARVVTNGARPTITGAAQMMRTMPIPAALIRAEEELRWVLEMPGVPKSGIEVEVLAAAIKVRGARPAVNVDRGEQVLGCDLAMGQVERTLTLPFAVDPSQVQASLTDGMLTIRVRLPAGVNRAQRIEVR